MSIDLVKFGKETVERQFDEIVEDAVRAMKSFAPYPRNVDKGLGSYSTGETRMGIRVLERTPKSAFVGTTTPQAKFADDGRGAIHKNTYMMWRDKRGRFHKTKNVSAMQGWHFVEKTKEYIESKYK